MNRNPDLQGRPVCVTAVDVKDTRLVWSRRLHSRSFAGQIETALSNREQPLSYALTVLLLVTGLPLRDIVRR